MTPIRSWRSDGTLAIGWGSACIDWAVRDWHPTALQVRSFPSRPVTRVQTHEHSVAACLENPIDQRMKRRPALDAAMVDIVRDEEIRSGDPRIAGTRISVLDVKRRVIDGDEDPFAVAAEYDLDPAAVFTALAYYYENPGEMQSLEADHERRLERVRHETQDVRDRHEAERQSEEA